MMRAPISHTRHPRDSGFREESTDADDRRDQERRQTESEGFIYIPMVGWYCRRDQTRRSDDTIEEEPR